MLVTITFPHSPTSRWPLILEAAAAGRHTTRTVTQGQRTTEIHTVQFDLSPHTVEAILRLLDLTRTLRAMLVILEAYPVPHAVALGMLRCYQSSLASPDLRAYCWQPIPFFRPVVQTIPSSEGLPPVTRPMTFPCRWAMRHPPHLSTKHPSSLRQQVDAHLVRTGCAGCPSLRLDEWELQYGYGPPQP